MNRIPCPRRLRAAYLDETNFKYERCKVVAEIGCNHMGDLNLAKELMKLAKEAGASYAKFQKRCAKELLTEEQYNKPHPNPINAFGNTYGAHREFLEFDVAQHRELWKYGKEIGIEWATSVWDVTSARDMIQIPCDFLKVCDALPRARARARCAVARARTRMPMVVLRFARAGESCAHHDGRPPDHPLRDPLASPCRCPRRATTTSRCSRFCATSSRASCTSRPA